MEEYAHTVQAQNDLPSKTLPRLVVCALIIRDGKVLLERRAPTGVLGLDGMWDLPGGKVECGEEVEAALIREIAEEMMVVVRPVRLLPYLPTSTWVYAGNERRHWILAAYVCDLISGEPVCCDTLQWFGVEHLPEDLLEADRRLIMLAKNSIIPAQATVNYVSGPTTPNPGNEDRTCTICGALLVCLCCRPVLPTDTNTGLDSSTQPVINVPSCVPAEADVIERAKLKAKEVFGPSLDSIAECIARFVYEDVRERLERLAGGKK